MLDAVWALCAHSGLYTSQEQFIDTPTREKGQFLWDAANESETVMRTYGEQNLTWQGLRDMARAQTRYWPTGQVNEVYPNDDGAQNYPTFTALYPEWVWRYYLSTGDRATLAALLPTLTRLSDYLVGIIDPSTGLISGQPMSTNGDNQYGYDYEHLRRHHPERRGRQRLPPDRRCGRRWSATPPPPRSRASGPLPWRRPSTPAWSGGDGLYVDGLTGTARQSPHSSQLANAVALAYGVVPGGGRAGGGRTTSPRSTSRSSPTTGWSCCAPSTPGAATPTWCRLLTDTSFPGWAAIIKAGGTFTWETWTPSDLIGDSMSHGWGSSALVAIQEVLLGCHAPSPGRTDRPPW